MERPSKEDIDECVFEAVREIADRQGFFDIAASRSPLEDKPWIRWYRYRRVAFACLWDVQNSPGLRLARCFVAPEYRGHGIGEALVRRRFADAFAEDPPQIDMYGHQTSLTDDLGFEVCEEFKRDSQHLVWEPGRGVRNAR